MKVGFAFAVVIGVCLIGLGIYCLTWHHIQRMKGPMDPLEGVIFHKQFYRKDFSLLVERDMVDEVKPGPSNAVYEIKNNQLSIASLKPEPLTKRTLMTTLPNGNSNPEDLNFSLPDVSETYKPRVYLPEDCTEHEMYILQFL